MTSTPCPELPPEIVNLVIDELHDFQHDLEACALVCRSWVPQSRFHLFSTIRLSNRRRLLWEDVSSFLALCDSPYSTIPLARISDLTILVDPSGEIEYKNNPDAYVFDQLLTWQSPHDGKSIADVFGHLKTLTLNWIEWQTLSETARSMLHSAFHTVTELRLQHVVFETGDEFDTGDEFLEFLSSLTGLKELCLDGNVSVRAPGQASTMQSNVFSSHFHTINLKNLSHHSEQVIRAITPCSSLKNLSVHVWGFSNMSADCSMAIEDLLVSAGPSLESFKFCVELARVYEGDVNLDASLQHIHFTKNSNLRKITLDVDDSAYLVPFLERLTKNHYLPSLEKLHIPRLVQLGEMGSTPVDYKHIDGLLRHPYFSALGEFRCTQCVRSRIKEKWYDGQPIEGSWSRKEMESKIEKLKEAMPRLADEGILQVDQKFL
ncbi:hypothetical protein K435DRAFT_738006 [Dendrothele bispora CBS 962.96]|uniref:F-box domain-containing protein n=1 Tax=Dendrothele bispora (strain CBS 962.96) TaxID=1314807 RepID=A0A4S8KQT5_DENBC|nr:hypothetical protein K435DRAFT_738006 [Dendrothele bispora CBS 962.96]